MNLLKSALVLTTLSLGCGVVLAADGESPAAPPVAASGVAPPPMVARRIPAPPPLPDDDPSFVGYTKIMVCAVQYSPEQRAFLRFDEPEAKAAIERQTGCWRRVALGRNKYLQSGTTLIVLDRQPAGGFPLVVDGVNTGAKVYFRVRGPGGGMGTQP